MISFTALDGRSIELRPVEGHGDTPQWAVVANGHKMGEVVQVVPGRTERWAVVGVPEAYGYTSMFGAMEAAWGIERPSGKSPL